MQDNSSLKSTESYQSLKRTREGNVSASECVSGNVVITSVYDNRTAKKGASGNTVFIKVSYKVLVVFLCTGYIQIHKSVVTGLFSFFFFLF